MRYVFKPSFSRHFQRFVCIAYQKNSMKGHNTLYILYYLHAEDRNNKICRHMLLVKTVIYYFRKICTDLPGYSRKRVSFSAYFAFPCAIDDSTVLQEASGAFGGKNKVSRYRLPGSRSQPFNSQKTIITLNQHSLLRSFKVIIKDKKEKTRNRKQRRAAAKPAACAKPLTRSTLGSKGKRAGRVR